MEIKNIIFDLGGVLLNIDYDLTTNAFKKLGADDVNGLYTQAKQSEIFDEFEKGFISSEQFLNKMSEFLPKSTSKNEIINAWNAMILDLPQKRLDFLNQLKDKYQTVLLSNTNAIHIDFFYRKLKEEHRIDSIKDYFNNIYLSYQMGMRKPDPEIFREVCKSENFNAKETLFIDDSIQHIEGAEKIGIKAVYLDVKKDNVIDLLNSIL